VKLIYAKKLPTLSFDCQGVKRDFSSVSCRTKATGVALRETEEIPSRIKSGGDRRHGQAESEPNNQGPMTKELSVDQ
jgi:hypothetical protein